MLRIVVLLLATAVLSLVDQVAEAKPARNVVPSPGEKMFPTGKADIEARGKARKMADAKRGARKGPGGKRERPFKRDAPDALKDRKERKDRKRDKMSFTDRFADKFEKIAEKSGLSGDDLENLKTEMREHSAQRAKLASQRREILQKYKDSKDSAEAKAELDEVEKSLKEVSLKHREVMKKARANNDDGNKRTDKKAGRKGRKDRRPPSERNSEQMEARRAEMQERRSQKTKERLEKLWEEAQKGDFDKDELAAIRAEIDEFIASELELIKQISPPSIPLNKDSSKDKAAKQEEFAKRRDAAQKMKALGERRQKLEARIRKKEL